MPSTREGDATADALRRLLIRDLEAVRRELRAFPDEGLIWAHPPGAPNSAGTLALHLCGNLQHFVGAQLGATGYVRDRDAEFSDRDVPLAELERRIDQTQAAVEVTLALGVIDLDAEYPLEVAGVRLSTRTFLLHLTSHLAYHLGQIDYHRRIVTGTSDGVGAVAIPDLAAP
jgi:hypothetical protein